MKKLLLVTILALGAAQAMAASSGSCPSGYVLTRPNCSGEFCPDVVACTPISQPVGPISPNQCDANGICEG